MKLHILIDKTDAPEARIKQVYSSEQRAGQDQDYEPRLLLSLEVFPSDVREKIPAPGLKKIYEKFNHFDYLLSDPRWMGEEEYSEGESGRKLLNHILFELWKEIKKEVNK